MYAMFVDDSGSTRPHRAGAGGVSVHVLSGLVVHEYDIDSARDAIDGAKRNLFAGSDPGDWELHAYDMWNNRGDFSGARHGLNLEKKREVFSRSAGAIVGSGATLVSVVVWKNRLRGGFNGPRIRDLAWSLLAERFEAYLDSSGGRDRGMFFPDASSSANEAGIRRAIQATKSGIGRRKRRRTRIMDDVVFKDSRREPLIQGADVAAYILQRR